MEGLILAAGKGKRLRPDDPAGSCKPLIEVGSKPLVAYSLDNLDALGVERAVIAVRGSHAQRIEAALGDRYRGVSLEFAALDDPRGLVNTIVGAADRLESDVLLQLSDEIFVSPRLDAEFFGPGCDFDFAVGWAPDDAESIKRNFSIETGEDSSVVRCVEKPTRIINDMKGTGFCFFSRGCMETLKREYDPLTNQPNDLCDLMNLLTLRGLHGRAFRIADREINVNTPEDLERAGAIIRNA